MTATYASWTFWILGALIATERLVRGSSMPPRVAGLYAFAFLAAALSGAIMLVTQATSFETRVLVVAATLLCAISGGAQLERVRRDGAVVSHPSQ